MTPREKREKLEKVMISPYGVRSADSKGREKPEEPCDIRTDFQRDVDRITHSKAFRRLKHKTQVFLQPEGDHYRTRLTHTLEVARIARTIARSLELNEDLAEAIALGHDLGHTPFGHAGERVLNSLLLSLGGFRHYEQSVRVVDRLERDGQGLNLTCEVRDGILRHTCDPLAATLEGQAVRLADKIAYINHDADDAIRAGILRDNDIPPEIVNVLGTTYSERIDTITRDVISVSCDKQELSMSPGIFFVVESFNDFMFEWVYKNPVAKSEESKVYGILSGISEYYLENPDRLPTEYRAIAQTDGDERAVCDYVSGMTDKYAMYQYGEIFIPAAWTVR
ncbi:MAG: deoxyguanosinetriphosphate triphosphohydrolase [Oscillospiraceae bacterium]